MYQMEELLPIVGKLAEKYTGMDSTSISYEKAEQLMEAVLYCIAKAEDNGPYALTAGEGASAQELYRLGKANLEKKVKAALKLYHDILPEFCSYGNPYLKETFLNGLPGFFQWYDVEFAPQNTLLTLDYPVLKDLSLYTGMDKIYEFLVCMKAEQAFLKVFPEDYVKGVLRQYYGEDTDMVDNICEILLLTVSGHILVKKGLTEKLSDTDYQKLRYRLRDTDLAKAAGQLRAAVRKLAETYCESPGEILEYLTEAFDNLAVRLKNASDYGEFHTIIF